MKMRIKMMPTIPIKKSTSAAVSTRLSRRVFPVLIATKDIMLEKVNNRATIAVNSSTSVVLAFSAICSDVISKRQNPIRFVQVPKICGDVLFAIK